MIIPETEIRQLDGEIDEAVSDDDFNAPDTYRFWGIIQTPGLVKPVNIDHDIYYSSAAVMLSPDPTGTPIRVDHIQLGEGIGEVIDEALLDDYQFTLNEITRQGWEGFVQDVEDENGNISVTYNQLVREIHAGNLALSAGLKVSSTPTQAHEYTVTQIKRWDEVSIVGKPAAPGSWAWACGDSCDIVFGEQSMSDTKTLNVDLEQLQQAAEEDDDVPSQLVEVLQSEDWDGAKGVQITPDGKATILQSEEDLHQSSCGCESEEAELREELQQARKERDNYKDVVEQIRQQQREDAGERLREINGDLPEDEQYSEQELEDFIEESTPKHLNQTADMLERIATVSTPNEPEVEQGKEDLTGTSGTSPDDDPEKKAEEVNRVAQGMFGKPLDEVFDEIESGTWGN